MFCGELLPIGRKIQKTTLMEFNKPIIITLKDFKNLILDIKEGSVKTRIGSLYDQLQNPLGLLLYNQFCLYTKNEIEKVDKNKKTSFYSLFLETKNQLLFSCLLAKGCEQHLHENSVNFLKTIPIKTGFVYNTIYNFELQIDKEDLTIWEKLKLEFLTNEKNEKNITFIINDLIKDGQFPTRLLTIHIDLVGQKHSNLIKRILESSKVDISSILNDFLPVCTNNQDEEFYISSLKVKNIKTLIDLGFKFQSQNYRFNNQSLIAAVIESGRSDLINIIIPNMSTYTPPNGDWETQNNLILSLNDERHKEIKDIYTKRVNEETYTSLNARLKEKPAPMELHLNKCSSLKL